MDGSGIFDVNVVRKRGRPKKPKTENLDDGSQKRQNRGFGTGLDRVMGGATKASNKLQLVEETLLPDESKSSDELKHSEPLVAYHNGKITSSPMKKKQTAIPGGLRAGAFVVQSDFINDFCISDEAMKGKALEVVLSIHGMVAPFNGGAANYPGETGQGGGESCPTLCSCCKQPEIRRQTIVCDACEQSFHINCVKLSSVRADDLDDWACPSCTIAFGVSGIAHGLSSLDQLCRDKQSDSQAWKSVSENEVPKNGKVCHDVLERNLDLNIPAELQPSEDFHQTENALESESLRQLPSWSLVSLSGLQGCKQADGSSPSVDHVRIPSVAEKKDKLELDSRHPLSIEFIELSSTSSETLLSNSIGKLFESDESDSLEACDDVARFSAADAKDITQLDSSSLREEHHVVTPVNMSTSPTKLAAVVSKELEKGFPAKPPVATREIVDVCGRKPITMREEMSSSSRMQPSYDIQEVNSAIHEREGIPEGSVDDELGYSKGKNTSVNLPSHPPKPPVSVWTPAFEPPAMSVDFGSSDQSAKCAAIGQSKRFDPLLRRSGRSTFLETVGASHQEHAEGQVHPILPLFISGEVNCVDLAGVVRTEPCLEPQFVPYVDQSDLVHDSIDGPDSHNNSVDISFVSLEEQQLKKVREETLQQLKDYVHEKHGLFLACGWEVEVRRRRNERHLDKYYISPEKQRFRSKIEVMRYLGLSDNPKGKYELRHTEPSEWSMMVQKVAKGKELQLPVKCGELMIESLGQVDMRSSFRNELQIWPVGYRSTWHDSTTASFCISEIVDNGASTPLFRVTRKFCPTLAFLTNQTSEDTLSRHFSGRREGGNVRKGDLDNCTKGTRTFRHLPFFSALHGPRYHYGIVSDREDRESLKALLGYTGDSAEEQDNMDEDGSEYLYPRDTIGEFIVEGGSTSQVWRLFAEEFVERCRKTPWVLDLLPDICPHLTTVCGLDRSVATKILGCNDEISPDLPSADLLVRLGEDRFGLTEALVKGMIEALPNADSCMGYKSLEQRGLSWMAENPAAHPSPDLRLRGRDKARKQRTGPYGLVDERASGVNEAVTLSDAPDFVVLSTVLERSPPPRGQPIGRRFPPELVGDVLQIWEFLSRFADVIGQTQPPLLEDLEEGLICEDAIVQHQIDQSTSMSANWELGGENVGKSEFGDVYILSADRKVSVNLPGVKNGDLPQSPQPTLMAAECSSSLDLESKQSSKDRQQETSQQEDFKSTCGNRQVASSSIDATWCGNVNENSRRDGAGSSAPKWVLSSGFATASSIHIPLVNYLLSDLQSKVCGPDEVLGDMDESKPLKRGRKRLRDSVIRPVFGREKLSESFSMNQWTWPEIARRYIMSVFRLSMITDIAEDKEECMKVLRCIQGDGGVLCGALDGVAGMEVDAQLLAEAEKALLDVSHNNEDTPTPTTPQLVTGKEIMENGKTEDKSEGNALWIKILDPIAKLPTNVGSRIRNRVRDALEAGPPEWAVGLLEESISKQVYKGNASGPTKRIVMDVLSRFRGEDPKVRKSKKLRKRERVIPSPVVVMQRCRIVLRQVAAADTERIVSTGIGSIITNFYESEGGGLLARPLDFRAIDLRLGAGAYGISPAAFAADVRQIWKNVSLVYGSDSIEVKAVMGLSELFESLFSRQVTTFQGGVESTPASGADGQNTCETGGQATEDQRLGPDGGETVKAPWEDDSCRICGIDDDHDNVLLCDGCDAEYHIYCLNPPLVEVPDGNWYCLSCVAVDKGFLEVPMVAETVVEGKALETQDHHIPRKVNGDDIPVKEDGSLLEDIPLRALVMKLAETDYWHLNIAERVQFLKFLCDQALETLNLRIRIEETMDVATEFQHKLRHLLAERRRYSELKDARLDNSKEALVAFSGSQDGVSMKRQHLEHFLESVTDVDQLERLSGQQTRRTDRPSFQKDVSSAVVGSEGSRESIVKANTPQFNVQHGDAALRTHVNGNDGKDMLSNKATCDAMEIEFPSHLQSEISLGVSEEHSALILETQEILPETNVSPNEVVGRHKGTLSSWRNGQAISDLVLKKIGQGIEEDSGKVTLPRGLSTPLDLEIEKAIIKLRSVNLRRDMLGKDDNGREYWILFGSKSTPWLVVEVVPDGKPLKERGRSEVAEEHRSECMPSDSHSLEKWVNSEVSKMSDCTLSNGHTIAVKSNSSEREIVDREGIQKMDEDEHRWYVYSNEEVLDQLLEWLLPTSSQEKALKSTLLQWKDFFFTETVTGLEVTDQLDVSIKSDRTIADVEHTQNSNNAELVSRKARIDKIKQTPTFPILRATRLLELKYGPFCDYGSKETRPSAPPKRGRKKKVQPMAELTRCTCLEPVWLSRFHCLSCHATFESAVDLEVHRKKLNCNRLDNTAEHSSGRKPFRKGPLTNKHGLSSKPPGTPRSEDFSIVISMPPDIATMPFIVHDSTQDRINQIGLIADNGPTFAPGLFYAPAFDPALMILDSMVLYPTSSADQPSSGSQRILDTHVVGGTSRIRQGDAENFRNQPQVPATSSDDLPGEMVDEASNAFVLSGDPLGLSMTKSNPIRTPGDRQIHKNLLLSESRDPKLSLRDSELQGDLRFVSGSSGHVLLSRTGNPGGRLFQVTGKQLVISQISLLPLESKDLNLLQQLKMNLLDMEAVLSSDMLEGGRASSSRRQNWRSFVKSAQTIYMIVQSSILLEQMISADLLRSSWSYWSSFSAAAKTATLSSLFLRICALDAAIVYENSSSYTGPDISSLETILGKREKDREARRGSNQTEKVIAKKRRKDSVAA